MMAHAINHSVLLQSQPEALVIYLRELLKYHEELDISIFLFSAVEAESLPPTIFSTWLTISTSISTLLRAFKQDFSIYIRYSAIKRFKKLVRHRNWEQVWNGIGGTAGILQLLSKFSVAEVQTFISSLPRQLNSSENAEQRVKITELLQGLLPSLYPNSSFKTSDERPLTNTYSKLVPGCTSKFVDAVLKKEKSPLLQYNNRSGIQTNHYELLRRYCLDIINQVPGYPIHINGYLGALFTTSPPLPSHKRGFSESMLFSLDVLRKLVARSDLQIPGTTILPSIICPLVQRARKKHLPWSDIEEIMDLSIKYLDTHPEEKSHLSFKASSFLYFSIIFWVMCNESQRQKFEARLISVLRHAPYDRHSILREGRIVLYNAPRSLRYRLLCIFFLNGQHVMDDINTPEGLVDGEGWPCELFLELKRHEAIELLKRLKLVNSTDEFVRKAESKDSTILSSQSSQKPSPYTSSDLLLLFLKQGKPGSLERSTLFVNRQKEKAVRSRDQEDRAFCAKSALLHAIASGSITLYSETLLWSRRWVRDPLTAKIVFSNGNINAKEAISLLSGIPNTLDGYQHLTLSDVSNKMIEANKVMFTLFETVCLALKEPFFQLWDWDGYLQLPYQVIKQRIGRFEEVQTTFQKPGGQEIYNKFWSDTLDLILRIERICLEPGYEALSRKNPSITGLTMTKISPASFRFIDDLARGRDAIWRQFRISQQPAVTVLPPCLPKGLPIQCLTRWADLAVEDATGLTPFIHSRAMSIVFQNLENALIPVAKDKETRSAITSFIDSFEYALKIYVLQGPLSEKENRFSHAWTHSLKKLSYRMTPDEAHRTWKVIFQKALPKFDIPSMDHAQSNEYPEVPYDCNNVEWNPAEAFRPPQAVESRRLEPHTYLDCSISISSTSYHENAFFERPLQTTGFQPKTFDIWSTMRLSKREWRIPAVREGLLISSLLYIDSQTDDGSRLLSEPFPSRSTLRYPAIWLDMEFMELDGVGFTQAMSLFEDQRFLSTVPSTLLLKLALTAIEYSAKVTSKEPVAHGSNLDGKICNILSLLTRSDRPHLAIDLVLKILIEYPDASSWHRQILSDAFLKRLSAEQSQDMLQRFLSAIQNKMRERVNSSNTNNTTIPADSTPKSKAYVKITTIKYLAQLLNGALFVSPTFSVNILMELLHSSAQIDIRVAVVQSLLEMLDRCSIDFGKAIGDQIISALETLIPVAGDLDERRQLREEDWALAEMDQNLPEIFEKGALSLYDSIPPILELLIGNRYDDHWKVQKLRRLHLPILEQSIRTNQKWLEIFASKHGLDLKSLDLPLLPVKPKILKDFIRRFTVFVPASLLDLYHRFVLFNISPPEEIVALNKKLEAPEYRDLQETKHWLSMFGQAPFRHYYQPFELLSALFRIKCYGGPSTDPNCITISQVENLAYSQAQALIYYPDPSQFVLFVSPLKPYPVDPYLRSQSAKKLLQRIVTFINTLRTPAWQLNQTRNPDVLPDTLKYRICLAVSGYGEQRPC